MPDRKKRTKKSATHRSDIPGIKKPEVPGVPFKKGHDPRRGRGPKKGAPNAGRPPDLWTVLCRRYVNRPKVLRAVRRILRDEYHRDHGRLFTFLAEQGYGKAKQSTEISGKLTLAQLLAESRKEEGDEE